MEMKHLKKLTLLHSNDLHGDFLVEKVDNKLIGGVSMLSGYVNKARREEENVVYVIAGDMFQGSLIDSEYKGISTIEIMNLLAPDVVTIGNHEVDYGLAHLLFLEKCANFPIINANMYLKSNGRRLFKSHEILHIDGMKVLFIGILTEEVLQKTKLGLAIRTTASSEKTARLMGVPTKWVTLFAWALALVLGTLAGTMIAPSTSVTVNLMDNVQVNAFIACVLGGFQTFYGPVLGAYIIAIATNLLSYYVSSVWGAQILYALVIIFIVIKPVGLIGKRVTKKV